MTKRYDKKRTWADELALLLATDSGRRTAELLHRARQTGEPGSQESHWKSASKPAGPRMIQIWRPTRVGKKLQFIRPEPGPFSDHYAQRRCIPAMKPKGTQRICLFGESAAAGYLYAPHLTPAMVLQAQLCSEAGARSYEVLDFARTNETLNNLVKTVEASLQLSPDILVLYAGNNWNLLETPECSPYFPDPDGRAGYAKALQEGGLEQVAEWSARRLLTRASSALEAIAELVESKNLPLVIVVPEVNLADWQNRQPVPFLPADGTASWYRHYHLAMGALDQGEAQVVLDHATDMLRLDGWSGPTAYRLMSCAYSMLRDTGEARQAARAEVDNVLYSTQAMLGSPQAGSMVQELLRQFATSHNFVLVDLPGIFSDHLNGELPGCRLFLDYCHLSVEGMQLAMAGVCTEILKLFERLAVTENWKALLTRLPAPEITPQAEATALFGAAMHTAHRMASVTPIVNLLEYWCDKAITSWPGIATAMQQVLKLRGSSLPEIMHKAELENQQSDCPLNPQHGWRYDYADADLQTAIINVLNRHRIAVPVESDDAIPAEGIELTNPRHQAQPLNCFYPELMPDSPVPARAWQRYAWPESRFCLSLIDVLPVRLIITLRLPEVHEAGAATVELRVNGQFLGALTAGCEWSRHSLCVGSEQLRQGVNYIALIWPIPEMDGETKLERAVSRLQSNYAADVHPVFGELACLRVKPDEHGTPGG